MRNFVSPFGPQLEVNVVLGGFVHSVACGLLRHEKNANTYSLPQNICRAIKPSVRPAQHVDNVLHSSVFMHLFLRRLGIARSYTFRQERHKTVSWHTTHGLYTGPVDNPAENRMTARQEQQATRARGTSLKERS